MNGAASLRAHSGPGPLPAAVDSSCSLPTILALISILRALRVVAPSSFSACSWAPRQIRSRGRNDTHGERPRNRPTGSESGLDPWVAPIYDSNLGVLRAIRNRSVSRSRSCCIFCDSETWALSVLDIVRAPPETQPTDRGTHNENRPSKLKRESHLSSTGRTK